MSKKIIEIVEEYIDSLGADGYEKGKSWKGYDVYVPQYARYSCVGYPYVVLVKGEEVRLSTEKESIEYLSYSETEAAKEKNTDRLKIEQTENL